MHMIQEAMLSLFPATHGRGQPGRVGRVTADWGYGNDLHQGAIASLATDQFTFLNLLVCYFNVQVLPGPVILVIVCNFSEVSKFWNGLK